MKFWRNVNECLEVHESLPVIPVVNLVFPSAWKSGMLPVMAAACELQIVIPSKLAAPLQMLFSSLEVEGGGNWGSYKDKLRGVHKSKLDPILEELERHIVPALVALRPASRWRRYGEAPSVSQIKVRSYNQDSMLKKGLIKLMVMETDEQKNIWKNLTCLKNLPRPLLEKAIARGLVNRNSGLVERYLADESLLQLRRAVDEQLIWGGLSAIYQYHQSVVEEITAPISEGNAFSFTSFLSSIQNKKEPEIASQLSVLLWDFSQNYPDTKNLPLAYSYAVGKAIDKTVSHRRASEACGLPMIGGVSPLPQFFYGKGQLKRAVVGDLGKYFARIFAKANLPPLEDLQHKLLSETYDKLMKHRYANPLVYLCIAKCADAGLSVSNPQNPSLKIGNGLADYARKVLGATVPENVAETHFSFEAKMGKNSLIVLVVSAYDATHKHKEYPGRWRNSLLEWDAKGFKWRSDIPKCLVVLDGVWLTLVGDMEKVFSAFKLPGILGVMDSATFVGLDKAEIQNLLCDE
jgi:hypothetical protein